MNNLFTFFAMALIMFVLIKSRRRVRCLETELERNKLQGVHNKPVETYQENRLAKIVEMIREQEARLQNRALLMEILIEDADGRIEKLGGGTARPTMLQSQTFKKDFLSWVAQGDSDEKIAQRINKQPWVVGLLRDLWKDTPH